MTARTTTCLVTADRLSPFFALGHGQSQGRPDDEHEERLDEVPKAQPGPRVMVELRADEPEDGSGQPGVPEMLVEQRALPDQEEHGQAAEEIEGQQAFSHRRRGRRDMGRR